MGTKVSGYNILFKMNSKTILGVTQDELQVSAQTKDSITKDDAGTKNTEVTGHEITFNASGLVEVKATGETSKVDANDLLEQSLKKGSAAIVPFVYDRGTGLDNYSGNCIMTDYSESSPADPDSDTTWSATFKVSGDMSKVTQ